MMKRVGRAGAAAKIAGIDQISRRDIFQRATTLLAGAALLRPAPAVASQAAIRPAPPRIGLAMTELSAYMSDARRRALPEPVIEKVKHHVLDTFAAMLSGADLVPGRAAIGFARAYGGPSVATVAASSILCGRSKRRSPMA